MIDELKQTNHDKTLGLKNPATYVLTGNRFNTYMLLIFSVLDEAQIYKNASKR